MKTVLINNTSYIEYNGRLYQMKNVAYDAVTKIKWANHVLSKENIQFPNGNWLHECANETIEINEDILLKYLVVTA